MRTTAVFAVVLVLSAFALGQSPAPTPVRCSKTVAFAVAESGQPVPAIPKFVLKWLAGKDHLSGYPTLCFSQIPATNLSNYLVIFSSSELAFEGLTPSAHTYTSAKPAGGSGPVINSAGGTWSYSYSGLLPVKVTSTADLQHYDKPKTLFVRVYNQQGLSIGHYNLGTVHPKEKLLEQTLADVRGDMPAVPRQKPFPAPLSVYYVNCDVDGPPGNVAMEDPPKTPQPQAPPKPAPPDPVFDFWSSPPGADIILDGKYVGQTPATLTVSPGEHTIVIRKKDFSSWQGKVTATPGKRRVAAHLEQKTLTLD